MRSTTLMSDRPHVKILTSNDLTYDQRMHKIADSMDRNGYAVELIGRRLPRSISLGERNYRQSRLNCFVHSGPLFYLILNLRLFLYLLFHPFDLVYAVDLDTLSAGWMAGKLKGKPIVYDAHEYFTEVPELEGRPLVKGIWDRIARFCIPKTDLALTVGPELADVLSERYGLPFRVVRNCPVASGRPVRAAAPVRGPVVLFYQGALNKGRGLEYMIEALEVMEGVELWLAGEGDLSGKLRQMVKERQLEDRVRFLGMIPPDALPEWTARADIGLNLLEGNSLNYYYSLANKFLDYIHAGLPSVNMDFPEYRKVNEQYDVAVLVDALDAETLSHAVYSLLQSPEHYLMLRNNCLKVRNKFSWRLEEAELLRWMNTLSDPA